MHGDSMLEGTFETNRRHLRNPFENISEAVLEILWVYPGKWTMVNIVLEQGGTLRKISGILKERVVEKVSKVT